MPDALPSGTARQIVHHVWQRVDTEVALRDAGFVRSIEHPDRLLTWSGQAADRPIELRATRRMFGDWLIQLYRFKPHRPCEARNLLPSACARGRVEGLLVDLWEREIGAQVPVPSAWATGVCYRQYQADLLRVDLRTPFAEVDGEVLRATRRWMNARSATGGPNTGPVQDRSLTIGVEGPLLHLGAAGITYGCPVLRGSFDTVAVPLAEFLALPSRVLRGQTVELSVEANGLRIGAGWIAKWSLIQSH